MMRILIVSPDPENARMLSLAFELEGWETNQSSTLPEGALNGTDAVVMDLVEGEREARAAAKRIGRVAGPTTAVVLPRGYGRERAADQFRSVDLIVPRPFELTRLVQQITELARK